MDKYEPLKKYKEDNQIGSVYGRYKFTVKGIRKMTK